MGQSQSTYMKSVTDVFNENSTKILQNTVNEAKASCNITQTVDFRNLGNINCGGNLTVGNKATALCNMTSAFSNKSVSDIKNMLKTSLGQTLNSSNQAVQGFLTGISQQSQQTTTDIENKMANIIDTTVSNEIMNSCLSESNPDQFLKAINYKNIDVGGNCDFTNETQVKVMANCLSDIILNSSTASETFSDIDVKAAIQASATQKGLDDFIGTLLEGITGPIKYAIIAVVVVLCVVVVGAIMFLLSPAGQQASTELASAASKKI